MYWPLWPIIQYSYKNVHLLFFPSTNYSLHLMITIVLYIL